jgi:hypothetical protein
MKHPEFYQHLSQRIFLRGPGLQAAVKRYWFHVITGVNLYFIYCTIIFYMVGTKNPYFIFLVAAP